MVDLPPLQWCRGSLHRCTMVDRACLRFGVVHRAGCSCYTRIYNLLSYRLICHRLLM